MLMFCLLCADAIDNIYDSDYDAPLNQMVLQCTIGVINEDEDTEDDEDDESYKDCVVMEEELDDKGKYNVTQFRLYAYVRCT